MISKRLVSLIMSQLTDPWRCSINDRPMDMVEALDDAIGNDGYIDGVYFLKADYELVETTKLFPEYIVKMTLEVRSKNIAIGIGKIVSINVIDKNARIGLDLYGTRHGIIIPTDSDDMDSEIMKNAMRYGVKR